MTQQSDEAVLLQKLKHTANNITQADLHFDLQDFVSTIGLHCATRHANKIAAIGRKFTVSNVCHGTICTTHVQLPRPDAGQQNDPVMGNLT